MPEVSAATPVADPPELTEGVSAEDSPAPPPVDPQPESRSDEPPPSEEPTGVAIAHPISNDAFQHRVQVVMDSMRDNPENQLRCMAEIHSYLSLFEEGFREMQQAMESGGGPMGLIRMMFSRGKGGSD